MMKLVLLVVSAMVIFPADSRDIPDKPANKDFALYQDDNFPSDSKNINNEPGVRNVVHNTKNFPDGSGSNHSSTDEDLAIYTASLLFPNGSQGLNFSEVVQQSLQERKEGYEEPLRASCNDKFNSCQNNANRGLCKNNPFMMFWCTKACGVCGGVLIGDTSSSAQFLSFHTEKAYGTVSRCSNSRLAQLNNPHAFITYAANTYRGEHFWLAAEDRNNEGHWTWKWDRTPLTNFPWGRGEPNNWKPSGSPWYRVGEDCLEWSGYSFNDANCYTKRGFVCEHASWKR